MFSYIFKCTLKSDIVLSQTSATEGFHKSLDYIPGVKFLGITAKALYGKDESQTQRLFHSTKVQFGNAYPLVNSKPTTPTPFSYRQRKVKNGDEAVYLFGHEDFAIAEEGGQLKQQRAGFFNNFGKVEIDQNFSIKSAYDEDKRKSKDSQMYGYFSLPKNSQWQFEVTAEQVEDLQQIKEALQGTHRVGRSRASQYGLIEITCEDLQCKEITTQKVKPIHGKIWVYAQSDCCFLDEFGLPNFNPQASDFGLPADLELDPEKTQSRNHSYRLWNGKRNTLDAERQVTSKGSVWVFDCDQEVEVPFFVGAFQAEGLGRVLFNPSFLIAEAGAVVIDSGFNKKGAIDQQTEHTVKPDEKDALLQFLNLQQQQAKEQNDTEKDAMKFIQENDHEFKMIGASQWGHIRKSAKQFKKYKDLKTYLFTDGWGYLYHGVNEHKWRRSRKTLEEKADQICNSHGDQVTMEYLQFVASEIAKRCKKENL
ncbi:hypothetical protein [Persicobacter psychrovividus]|uniref:CRISPR-associated protein Csx10 n=1 Tax=Persicobacter psychrovividus TaxID=387638 RepID=A0ABM7VM18_9BACT|nr:hypothetical protein PEPS_43420 [Persicobacter psychrovividus]